MRKEEKIEVFLKHLGLNGWKIDQEDVDRLRSKSGKIRRDLSGHYDLGKKIVCKENDYIWFYGDDSYIDVEDENWITTITLYASGSGYLILPLLYHSTTEKDKINFDCRDYYVDLTHYNTEEEIANVIAQYEEKIAQVKFKLKEFEAKIREQKMKKDF